MKIGWQHVLHWSIGEPFQWVWAQEPIQWGPEHMIIFNWVLKGINSATSTRWWKPSRVTRNLQKHKTLVPLNASSQSKCTRSIPISPRSNINSANVCEYQAKGPSELKKPEHTYLYAYSRNKLLPPWWGFLRHRRKATVGVTRILPPDPPTTSLN